VSICLERLVIDWRDAEKERAKLLERALFDPTSVSPMDVTLANERRIAAAAALMKYAEEEMG
jgi:hypothetical protein